MSEPLQWILNVSTQFLSFAISARSMFESLVELSVRLMTTVAPFASSASRSFNAISRFTWYSVFFVLTPEVPEVAFAFITVLLTLG